MAPESHSAAVQLLTPIFALGTTSWKHNCVVWDHSGPQERLISACILGGLGLLWSKIGYPNTVQTWIKTLNY